jgi:hypothetical protein
MLYRFVKLFNIKLSEGDPLNMSLATLDYAISYILNIEQMEDKWLYSYLIILLTSLILI